MIADLTDWLKTPGGTMQLRQIQAAFLQEAHDHGGAFGPIGVGMGKTLITFLAPVVLGHKRPLLLVPAKLRDEKTIPEFAVLAKHFTGPKNLTIVSYEKLGRINKRTQRLLFDLEHLRPDGITCDEVHKLKNPKASCTKRVRRYMKDHPETEFVGLSGTITNRSIRDFADVAFWCLKHRSPLPTEYRELEAWSYALDERLTNEENRMDPGALRVFADQVELQKLDAARPADEWSRAYEIWSDARLKVIRQGFQKRLNETPGVVATGDNVLGASLSISCVEPKYNADTEKAFKTLRGIWETPDGWPIADGVTLWRHARELALGFYYRWLPRPPTEWLRIRSEWCSQVRRILSNNRRGLDSELQACQAVARGDYLEPNADGRIPLDIYNDWVRERDTFKPNTVAVWIDRGPLELCTQWLKSHKGTIGGEGKTAGIVWVEHKAFGHELARVSGFPYYGTGGKDANGTPIEKADPARSCIASISSNSEGRNLQFFANNLITSPIPTGRITEQNLARTHRPGTLAEEVTFECLVGCKEQYNALTRALEDCRYIQDMTGQVQKIVYADKIWPSADEIAHKAISTYRYR